MAILGWLFIMVLAFVLFAGFIILNYVSIGFTGRFAWQSFLYLVPSLFLFYLAYRYCPFEILII
jgi:hypothetical protein